MKNKKLYLSEENYYRKKIKSRPLKVAGDLERVESGWGVDLDAGPFALGPGDVT